MNIISWNMQGAKSTITGRDKAQALQDMIGKYHPWVIMIQEGGEDCHDLSKLGYARFEAPGNDFSKILRCTNHLYIHMGRLKFKKSWPSESLAGGEAARAGIMAIAAVTFGPGLEDFDNNIIFCSWHATSSAAANSSTMALLRELAISNQSLPIIVGGDFNSDPALTDDCLLRLISSRGTGLFGRPYAVMAGPRGTITHPSSKHHLDFFIYLGPQGAIRMPNFAVTCLNNIVASDHFPVLLEI